MKIEKNFDWSITNRKLSIFMPSFHDQKLTECSIANIKTNISTKDYVIIIGCDNVEQNFDHLKSENTYYFKLIKEDKTPRNGCFIRNYFIKRCESDLILQKDAEVVILGDFINNAINYNKGWKAGIIYTTTEEQKNSILNNDFSVLKDEYVTPDIFYRNANMVRIGMLRPYVNKNIALYFHYAFCMDRKLLQDINGYDERFKYHGAEDYDLFLRLYDLGYKIHPDYSCKAIHLYHDRANNIIQDSERNYNPFALMDYKVPKRNPISWGEG